VISRRAASEFPNDNPELHDGLVWACPEPRGRALPTLRIRALDGELPKVLGPAWERPAPLESPVVSVVRREVAPAAEHPIFDELPLAEPASQPTLEASPFDVFIQTVARVAMARGATRAAAAVTALLSAGRLTTDGVDKALLDGLVRRRILSPGSGHASPELAQATRAWRAVLEAADADLSGCGSSTLDAWAAELLAAVMNAPSGELGELRRELRRAGVAAFGLLAVA
jgi:hypothetical protein